jgi:hypothetical protein
VLTVSSREFSKNTRGKYSTPTRFRKSVSATFLSETSAQPTQNSAPILQATIHTSRRSTPSRFSTGERTRLRMLGTMLADAPPS